ncbi:MAG: alpha-amylase [Myxococcales bacterium]|nr:alpha-amylase [Myxococcales bacterium]
MALAALLLAPGCADFRELDDQAEVTLSTEVDDWRDEVIYQILVDRFANGDRGNDYRVDEGDLARYQGGDWQGLIDRMGYLQDLGVTTLWISPVVRNVETDANVDGYHGYWAQDFGDVNPHFGSLATLQELVRQAHARDMKVIIDIVTNHVGQAFYYDMNLNGEPDIQLQNDGGARPVRHYTEYDPDFDPRGIQAFTSLGEAGPAPVVFQYDPATNHVPPSPALFEDPAVYNRKGRTYDFDDPDQLLHGDFPGGLKDVDTRRCDVKQEFVEIYARWIEQTNADGYRIDTIKHVEYEFWRFFTQRLRRRLATGGKTNFLMFGEVFDGRDDLLGSFTRHDILGDADVIRLLEQQPSFDPSDEEQLAAEQTCAPEGPPLTGDQLDSVFYFSQHFQAMRDVFASAQSTNRIQALWESRSTTWGTEANELGIGVAPAQMPINFIDNHDVARFLFNLRDRDPDTQRALLHNVLAFITTAQGVPCIYYGTEQGFSGGNDPANRERLWDTGYDTTGATFQWTRRLLALRAAYPALRRGDTLVAWSTAHTGDEPDAGIFAFERFGADSGGSYALVVFNTHQGHPSTTAFEGQGMVVSAPANTVLVDALSTDGTSYVVAADGTLEITLEPMRGAILVPEGEYRAGI